MTPQTTSTANLKRHINLYISPDSLWVSTSYILTQLPPPSLSFSPLAAPANTLVSLRLQLMKFRVLVKTLLYFIFSLGSLRSSDIYRHESGRCCTLPFFLKFFLETLIRWSWYFGHGIIGNDVTLYYIDRFTLLFKSFTYYSNQQKLFGSIYTLAILVKWIYQYHIL